MMTVSIVDLFVHIAEEIGLKHTLCMSAAGVLAGAYVCVCVCVCVCVFLSFSLSLCAPPLTKKT